MERSGGAVEVASGACPLHAAPQRAIQFKSSPASAAAGRLQPVQTHASTSAGTETATDTDTRTHVCPATRLHYAGHRTR